MKKPDAFTEYVLDLLAPIPGITSGRMFSGTGFKHDGTQFAMIVGGTLYFVVDDTTRPAYEAMGSTCFSYDKKDRRVDVRRYYEVPAEVLDDAGRLLAFAEEAIEVARHTGK